jgi:PKHD-type hydroxylase
MLIEIPRVLGRREVAELRGLLDATAWADGRATAGTQSELVKNNEQIPEDSPAAPAARAIVSRGLSQSALFFSAALPRRIYPPLFNRYAGVTNTFGNHVDNAMRTFKATGERVRTDLSATLFLAEPDEYDGGELVVEDTFVAQRVKLAAGHMILYPSSSVHRVEPVTRGARVSSFFWLESMVRENDRRRVLFDLDMAILRLRETHGDTAPVVSLTGTYHNLLRMWADS